jgi:hypothetical protein
MQLAATKSHRVMIAKQALGVLQARRVLPWQWARFTRLVLQRVLFSMRASDISNHVCRHDGVLFLRGSWFCI